MHASSLACRRAAALTLVFGIVGFTRSIAAQADPCDALECEAGTLCRSHKAIMSGEPSAGGAGGAGGTVGGQGGTGGMDGGFEVVCFAQQTTYCAQIGCASDDDCEAGSICVGVSLTVHSAPTDPCPGEERCEVDCDGYEWEVEDVRFQGSCMPGQRCEDDGDCEDGASCASQQNQCACEGDPSVGPECEGRGGMQVGGSGGSDDGWCLCYCDHRLCVTDGAGGSGSGQGGTTGMGANGGAGEGVSAGQGASAGNGASAGGRGGAGGAAGNDSESEADGEDGAGEDDGDGGCSTARADVGTATSVSMLALCLLALRRRAR